jgi:hypothetical protein
VGPHPDSNAAPDPAAPDSFAKVLAEHHALLLIQVHGIVRNRLGRHFLEPVRRLCRNRNHIALGQVVRLPALDAGRAALARRSVPGVYQRATCDEGRLALDDDEDVVRLLVDLNFTCAAAIGQDDQAAIVDDRSALTIVADTLSWGT